VPMVELSSRCIVLAHRCFPSCQVCIYVRFRFYESRGIVSSILSTGLERQREFWIDGNGGFSGGRSSVC
jgi:hypothetical protein